MVNRSFADSLNPVKINAQISNAPNIQSSMESDDIEIVTENTGAEM